MGLGEKIKVGEKIQVLLEKIEDRNGEVLVSASKAAKIAGWDKLVAAYEADEPIMGKITSKSKEDAYWTYWNRFTYVFARITISDKPLKDISHLMNEPQNLNSSSLIKRHVYQEKRLYLHLRKRIKQNNRKI